MSATTPEQVEVMREALTQSARGFRNLVEFEIIPAAYQEEALLQADLLENAAARPMDASRMATLRSQLKQAAAARKAARAATA